MSAVASATRTVVRGVPGLGAAIVVGALIAASVAYAGPFAPVALSVMAVGGFWLVGRPGLALALFLGLIVVMEEDKHGFLPQTARFYQAVAGGIVSPADLLFATLVAATALDLSRRRVKPVLPDPFTVPLLLMGAAVAVGTLAGWAGGADLINISYVLRVFLYFLAVPFLAVNLLGTPERQRTFVVVAAALAAYKGVEGTLAYAAGAGRQIEGVTLTFYEPTATWMIVLFLLGVVALRIMGERLPWWTLPASLFTLSALVFSFRRSFWIAAVLGVIAVVVIATGQHGVKRVLPPVIAFVVAAGLAVFFVGFSGNTALPAPVLERAQSLNPSSLQATKSDRYRITEQRNVIAELRAHPVIGTGLGVPWEPRYPLSASFVGSRGYTHVLVFNYWLKMGVLGVIAYIWITLAALWAAMAVWRSRAETLVRGAGLALFGGILGLIVTDLTGSHTGVNLRLTTVFAAGLGWMAAVIATQRARERRDVELGSSAAKPEPDPDPTPAAT